MQHRRKGSIFSRPAGQRKALMKSLASSFFLHGRITTTEAKAKALRPYAEKMITRAKRGDLAAHRALRAYFSSSIAKKVLEYGKSMADRKGGYTRIIKITTRTSDSARMAIIEMVK